MNYVTELLKIADMLDKSGAYAEADEIVNILEENASDDAQKRRAKSIASVLIRVADSLDAKGAHKEAQLADQLLSDIPQAFLAQNREFSLDIPMETTESPVVTEEPTDVMETEVTDIGITETDDTPFSELSDATEQVEQETEVDSSEIKEQVPPELDIQEAKEEESGKDYLTLNEFEDLISSMKYRHSQGPKRQTYEQILERAKKAAEYKKAFEEWLDYAHQLFGDEPIRLKL